MNPLKRLAGQTAVYGIPSILGRFLGYLLVPMYTRVFLPDAYGTVNVFYSYAAFLIVILTYGMETAFFKFNQDTENKDKVYSTGLTSLIVSSLFFLVLASLFSQTIANWMGYSGNSNYIVWFAWILALDALTAIPFARLRALNKAFNFATVKLINILTNIGLNLFFILLCPYVLKNYPEGVFGHMVGSFYKTDWGIEYIFISNLVSSAVTLLLLVPQFRGFRWQPDRKMLSALLVFAFPLLFAGMAGIVNETFDRIMLRYLLPMSPKLAEAQVGIYGACYKISILMTLFIQAYRFAAEPFFFAQAKEKDAKVVYAKIMDYFIITVSVIFLVTMLYLDDFVIRFIGHRFTSGRNVIPILMLANLFLGVYYNLSIWYKLTSQTMWGAWLAIIGAIITLVLNFWWIPLSSDHLIHGYLGSAWATFICYGSMMVLSYLIGQKYFPVNYNLKKFFGYLGLAVLLYLISSNICIDTKPVRIIVHSMFLLIFLVVAFLVERPRLSKAF
ncbi:MAG: oligosaccharide flippase family protein [Bacteroidetes bacterium]|nr:oligosaccharide flippase family protein [Bacteroidota bacterium]